MMVPHSDLKANLGGEFWHAVKLNPDHTPTFEALSKAALWSNAKAYEVELLVAPSRVASMGKTDRPVPIPLPEQEWLLNGRFVDHVICARDGSAARVVAPDPRWFALHKLWMSDQEKRNALKRPKDRKQGIRLLDAIAAYMPHYPLDDAFASALPDELAPYLERWRTTGAAGNAHPPAW